MNIEARFLDYRKNKTAKDADIIIKMSTDFIKDMEQKMYMIRRTERHYQSSSDYVTGSLYDDILRRFKHMCDMYKQYASVNRYVLGKDLNDSAPNWDVVVVYQVMLSDYNEILMLMELLKLEQRAWSESMENDEARKLIEKQLNKFGTIPKGAKAEPLVEDAIGGNTRKPDNRRKWASGDGVDYPQKWSGELDGVGFDDR
ncbi:uncharacterized protein LOC125239063 [Leguminivora glycinivorella]|uniref:uncharacterized protein LOC125239063 n=1 Tax=Leguminivora glycinivorella TaxID=1035111 RepID=UPI0020101074|nr:uncharacterized protein LOC125239063 [Leguminivora glycinivorella]